MILNVEFSRDMNTSDTIGTDNIPCRFFVKGNRAQVIFSPPVLDVVAEAIDYDLHEFQKRAPAMGGDDITYDNACVITIKPTGPQSFDVTDLSLFYAFDGWTKVIENSAFTEIEDEIE